MKILITGGCGFLGSNLAEEGLKRRDEITVFDNLGRLGGSQNLTWLKGKGSFRFVQGDVRNSSDVYGAVREAQPDVTFHLAGQVAMTTSIEHPRLDFETNTNGTFNVLESVRTLRPESLVVYSSTNKVYGDLETLRYEETDTRFRTSDYPKGFDETTPLDFRSPYGCSKGAADQYMLDYARVYGLQTVIFRHSSIYGNRQFSTADQGWIGWFVDQALKRKAGTATGPLEISGNGKQVRDVLFSSDLVQLYFNAILHREAAKGQAFNIGGGMTNSLSLIELFRVLSDQLGVDLPYQCKPWRQSDQKVFVADISKAERLLNWKPKISKNEGLSQMIEWVNTK